MYGTLLVNFSHLPPNRISTIGEQSILTSPNHVKETNPINCKSYYYGFFIYIIVYINCTYYVYKRTSKKKNFKTLYASGIFITSPVAATCPAIPTPMGIIIASSRVLTDCSSVENAVTSKR